MGLDPQLLLRLYRNMLQVRAFELALEREFKRGNVPGMLHTGLGQEAVQAAIAANLRPTDCFFPDHRCHGLLFLAGTPGERIMAELFGKATGICSGKGGSLHSADVTVGNFGDNAIEGSMMVTALGAALGWKLQKTDRVAVVIVGDGTSGRGEWHESMNLAATWRVPLLYACINNGYAISTPVGYSHATADLVDFARAYKMPALQVDGNDIEQAYLATCAAAEYMRAGGGPYFIEYKTWRWQGLFSGEFRPAEEVDYYRNEHDPVKMARAKILALGLSAEDILDNLAAEVNAEIEAWITFAKTSPPPSPLKATSDVYVGWEVASR